MKIQKSIQAFMSYARDYQKLPVQPRLRQFPKYLGSYLEGRLASRNSSVAKSRKFSFLLNQPLIIWLQPEHFGMAKGILQDREYSNLPLVSKPSKILDLGANIGLGLLALHDQYPDAEFAAVEADPRNFELLLKNLEENKLQASLLAVAVAGKQEILSLRIGENSTCSTLIDESLIHPSHSRSIGIPVLDFPSILDYLNWDFVDLLKIDIEGAEESLFSHSADWLNRVGAIVLEIHPNTTPEKIQSLLAPYGFYLRRHTYGREPVYFADRSN